MSGHVKGLRARGGFAVDITWENGRLTSAQVQSILGNQCHLRYRETVNVRTDEQNVSTQTVEPNGVRWQTVAGQRYTIYL